MKKALILIHIFSLAIYAQFDPQIGSVAKFAIQKDSTIIKSWAVNCDVTRGLQNISDSTSGYTSYGQPSDATGKSDGKIISLGDGGSAILTFKKPIANGPGADFAVFENGFKATAPLAFLELAYVEVSSDGTNYFRFPAISKTDTSTQTNGFGYTDASKLYNLAGKYIANYGTPFDLEELRTIVGLDVNYITHVKIIDVVGDISAPYATRDSQNNKVNDPWPTPFTTCGFDLEAVAVIYESTQAVASITGTMTGPNTTTGSTITGTGTVTGIGIFALNENVKAFPNPVKSGETLYFNNFTADKIWICDILGLEREFALFNNQLNTNGLAPGVYWLALGKKRIKLMVE
jgi:hypothetical protein